MFGKVHVFQVKKLRGIKKNRTKNKYNILLRASEVSEEIFLAETCKIEGISVLKARGIKG